MGALAVKLNDLTPGQFFEFRSPGYCFARCIFIGWDEYRAVNYIHQTAGGDRFLLNNMPFEYNPTVEVDVPQCWDRRGREKGAWIWHEDAEDIQ